jgi:Uncharacterized conserved protein
MVQIVTPDYTVEYVPEADTVFMSGTLRLPNIEAYQPILDILLSAIASAPPLITIDLQKLEFLNSSGLSMLLMFVVKVRDKGGISMVVKGSQEIPWQAKSLKNLRRLMPEMVLEML